MIEPLTYGESEQLVIKSMSSIHPRFIEALTNLIAHKYLDDITSDESADEQMSCLQKIDELRSAKSMIRILTTYIRPQDKPIQAEL